MTDCHVKSLCLPHRDTILSNKLVLSRRDRRDYLTAEFQQQPVRSRHEDGDGVMRTVDLLHEEQEGLVFRRNTEGTCWRTETTQRPTGRTNGENQRGEPTGTSGFSSGWKLSETQSERLRRLYNKLKERQRVPEDKLL